MTAFTINIENLLSKRKIESNRIEFKEGWNPDAIYRTICAFANDYDNIGGGYILVGVAEENGVAVRPVKGIKEEEIDEILKKMVDYNHKIVPYYMPRTTVEEVDGKQVLAIWVPSGEARPYSVSPKISNKEEKQKEMYIRCGTSSIVAMEDEKRELIMMANRTPFDDRGNARIKEEDISAYRLRDYLVNIDSRLKEQFKADDMLSTLDAMNLLEGPSEDRRIKNVAAMMFCDKPKKFFPYAQVDIVTYPEGSIRNPNRMIEAPTIEGTVPEMIDKAMSYLKTNVIKEEIIKPKDDLRSIKRYNYPYQALEEAVTNALYHRDYQQGEPVEIIVEPDKIIILSYPGADRSIAMEEIVKGERIYARRYRNRRLGDFLKELGYTEGRGTGVPTMQNVLQENGSLKAQYETDEKRTYFKTIIYKISTEKDINLQGDPQGKVVDNQQETCVPQGVPQGVLQGDPQGGPQGDPQGKVVDNQQETHVPQDVLQDVLQGVPQGDLQGKVIDNQQETCVPQDVPQGKTSIVQREQQLQDSVGNSAIQEIILTMIRKDCRITREAMAEYAGVSSKTIGRELKRMKNVVYIGSGYSGYWQIKEDEKDEK